jgi:hypothetical protein
VAALPGPGRRRTPARTPTTIASTPRAGSTSICNNFAGRGRPRHGNRRLRDDRLSTPAGGVGLAPYPRTAGAITWEVRGAHTFPWRDPHPWSSTVRRLAISSSSP